MGALRERPTVTYEECHEDGCVIVRSGFHNAQVRFFIFSIFSIFIII